MRGLARSVIISDNALVCLIFDLCQYFGGTGNYDPKKDKLSSKM